MCAFRDTDGDQHGSIPVLEPLAIEPPQVQNPSEDDSLSAMEEDEIVFPSKVSLPPVEEDDPVIHEEEVSFKITDLAAKFDRVGENEDGNNQYDTDIVYIKGFAFQLSFYKRGHFDQFDEHMNVFLTRVPDEEIAPAVDQDAFTIFTLHLKSHTDLRWDVGMVTSKCFKAREPSNWGWKRFIKYIDFLEGRRGYTQDQEEVFVLNVRLVRGSSLKRWRADATYDSKEITGMVGIMNQGATCYMNSLLQALFFTDELRRGVFKMPTVTPKMTAEDFQHVNQGKEKNVALAVQRVFYRLQMSSSAVETQELTKSFGWDGSDAFNQHDVQEFLRVLLDKIEEKMRSTSIESLQNLVANLFMGKMKSYIKCKNVDFESARIEDYYDIQLKVKDIPNLYDSFKDYCSVEVLDGENQYQAEGHGLQDAKKGVIFQTFPNVLYLQLRRFEFDMELFESVKVNDRFEFPDEICLDDFLEECDASRPADYKLHSVFVQVGSVQYGHYIIYIRPDFKANQWYKFDDETVTKCSAVDAIDMNFGGHQQNPARLSSSSAYMLVYMRKDWVLNGNVRSDMDVPDHLIKYFEQEAEENRILDEKQAELSRDYRNLTLIQEKDILNHADPQFCKLKQKQPYVPDALVILIERLSTNFDVICKVAKELNVDPLRLRLHQIIHRENLTTRPDSAVISNNELFVQGHEILNYFVTVANFDASVIKDIAGREVLIFLKKYDPVAMHLISLGCRTYRDNETTIYNIIHDLFQTANIESLDVYAFEELAAQSITALQIDKSLRDHELQSGDIIVIEEQIPGRESGTIDHYARIANRTTVQFRDLNNYDDEDKYHTLVLDKRSPYQDIVAALAAHLGWEDADYIQLTSHCTVADGPDYGQKIHSGTLALKHIFPPRTTLAERILYYEKTNQPISVVESKTLLGDLSMLDHNDFSLVRKPFLASPNSCLDTVIREIISFNNLDPNMNYRMLQMIDNHSIYRILDGSRHVDDIYSLKLRFENVLDPCAEAENCNLVQVQHFFKSTSHLHGIPFMFRIYKDEDVVSFKERLRMFLKLEKTEFEKWTVHWTTSLGPNVAQLLRDDDPPDALWAPHLRILLNHKDLGSYHKRRKRYHLDGAVKILN